MPSILQSRTVSQDEETKAGVQYLPRSQSEERREPGLNHQAFESAPRILLFR